MNHHQQRRAREWDDSVAQAKIFATSRFGAFAARMTSYETKETIIIQYAAIRPGYLHSFVQLYNREQGRSSFYTMETTDPDSNEVVPIFPDLQRPELDPDTVGKAMVSDDARTRLEGFYNLFPDTRKPEFITGHGETLEIKGSDERPSEKSTNSQHRKKDNETAKQKKNK